MAKNIPLIMIESISYTYPNGTEALTDINLNISKGELVGIMGKNGAGKTTLIRTLNGLFRPTRGKIYIENENITTKTIATLSKKVGIVFQNPHHQLFANSVEEEIKFSLRSINLSRDETHFKINQILNEFDLIKYRNRSPLNLSGGESKKLAIALTKLFWISTLSLKSVAPIATAFSGSTASTTSSPSSSPSDKS